MKDLIQFEYIASIIIAIFASNGFWQYMVQKHSKKDVKARAILALLHDKLFYLCDRYVKEGWIAVDDFDNVTCLYEPYVEMGGNGTVHALYEKVKKLPNQPKEED